MKYRIISETNGLGETSVFVERARVRQSLFGSAVTSWEPVQTRGHIDAKREFESVEKAQAYIDERLAICAEQALRDTIVERKVISYP